MMVTAEKESKTATKEIEIDDVTRVWCQIIWKVKWTLVCEQTFF